LDGVPIPGTRCGNQPFYRFGAYGDWHVHKWQVAVQHDVPARQGQRVSGTGTPANPPLPPGALGPIWNGGFVETGHYWSPQLVLAGRYDFIRMENQAFPIGNR